jgi:gamma-glutamylcyclotransferase (GGCT)/AIG2-like uncharacterized protein YtfP
MKDEFLFVYGTLRRRGGGAMHAYLARNSDFVDEATCRGKLYNIGAYPGVVPSDDPADRVHGEVYRLRDPDRVLRCLDRYEGVGPGFRTPAEYIRLRQDVRLPDTCTLSAWIYIYDWPTDGLEPIAGGDFFTCGAADS